LNRKNSGVSLEDLIQLVEGNLLWHPEAAEDFSSLPENLRLDVLQQLVRLTINPKAGKKLEDKHGLDLRGYRKMFFAGATQRIIYSVTAEGKCKIWGICPRAGFTVYKKVASRLGS